MLTRKLVPTNQKDREVSSQQPGSQFPGNREVSSQELGSQFPETGKSVPGNWEVSSWDPGKSLLNIIMLLEFII